MYSTRYLLSFPLIKWSLYKLWRKLYLFDDHIIFTLMIKMFATQPFKLFVSWFCTRAASQWMKSWLLYTYICVFSVSQGIATMLGICNPYHNHSPSKKIPRCSFPQLQHTVWNLFLKKEQQTFSVPVYFTMTMCVLYV